MRRILTLCVLSIPMISGCAMFGDNRHCGVHFEILLPPSIDANTPILIQNGGQSVTAHPMGTLAGPVISGNAVHAPAAPITIAPQQMPAGRPGAIFGDCGPVMPQAGWYRIEDLKNMQQVMQPAKLPTANGQEE